MLPPLPENFAWAENLALGSPEVYRLSALSWPRFLLEASDIADPLLTFEMSAEDFRERFLAFGIRDLTGQLIAFMQVVLVSVDPSASLLPSLGWRFSLQDATRKSVKNAVSLVEASIDPEFRGFGLSKALIERAKWEARRRGLSIVVAPVRPAMKSEFPFESMASYCERRTSDGRLYDTWLRTHADAGAEIVNVCDESVCIRATLKRWREWTGMAFDRSGAVVVPGALAPVRIDFEAGFAEYREENVWVRYQLDLLNDRATGAG